ncbi:MAG: hypothetical protein LBG76_03530 [Treponema sp.]|nr:hypothetical protein [Treponema sp.]
MTIPHKAALSLFISVFLFSGFAVMAYRGFFDLIESRFYNPSITKALTGEINLDTGAVEDYFSELEGRFAATLEEDAVQRSFLPYQNAEDIFERSKLYGLLLENISGLQSIRFIDAGGRRIHYSTLESDILRQDTASVAYRNYEDGAIPFENLAVSSQGAPKITIDQANDRIIFSFPFHDSQDVYRGTVLFTLSVYGLTERLAGEARISVGETVSLVAEPAGIVTRLPAIGQDTLISLIISIWNGGTQGLTALELADSTSSVLVSSKTAQGIFTGRFVQESLLNFSASMRLLLLAACFFTLYLLVFLLLNLRQDPLAIAGARLNKLRSLLIDEYERRKEDGDWSRWSGNLERRREDIRAELKKNLRPKRGKQEKELDAFIDRSWAELVAVINTRRPVPALIDEAKLREMVSHILHNSGLAAFSNQTLQPAPEVKAVDAPKETETEENGEALEELEEAEELEEVQEFDADSHPEGYEELEELEAMNDGSKTEELEELCEPEELEILENEEEPGATGASSASDIAMQIELSPIPELEPDMTQEKLEELEIVSPFPSILSGLDDTTVWAGSAAAMLESLDTNYRLSLLHTPFANESNDVPASIPIPVPTPIPVPSPESRDDGIIEFREGINYVSEKALHPEQEDGKFLDQRLKNLIDSVLSKPAAH